MRLRYLAPRLMQVEIDQPDQAIETHISSLKTTLRGLLRKEVAPMFEYPPPGRNNASSDQGWTELARETPQRPCTRTYRLKTV